MDAKTGLVIAFKAVPDSDLHRFALRWYVGNQGAVPTLYKDGKRVTQAWQLTVTADVPEDSKGANANTA